MPRMYCSHRLIVLPLDLPSLTTSRLRVPSSQRWNYIYKPLILDVPTFTTSRLLEILAAKGGTNVGEKWPMNFAWNAQLPRNIQGSFPCRKSTTWKEVVLRIFSPWKIRPLRPGLNPQTWLLKASTQPLDHRSPPCLLIIYRVIKTSLCTCPPPVSRHLLTLDSY
jgi:hypothetical protein